MHENDLTHYWGGDVAASSTGDFATASGSNKTTQRILRRLMTNPAEGSIPADYPAHPEYGAGLPRRVGQTVDIPKITALIRGQILLEEAVTRIPEPQISVQEIANGIACRISYTDSVTDTTQLLSFKVTA